MRCFKPVVEVLLPRRSGILSSSLCRHQRFQGLCNYRPRIPRVPCLCRPSHSAFYLTHPVQIFLSAVSVDHVNDSINGCWSWALYTIEGEIPPSAAIMTIVETKVSIEKDSQPSFGRFLLEKAFLWKLIRKEKITKKLGQLFIQN